MPRIVHVVDTNGYEQALPEEEVLMETTLQLARIAKRYGYMSVRAEVCKDYVSLAYGAKGDQYRMEACL